jgi:TrmH family RNA methyltransferase
MLSRPRIKYIKSLQVKKYRKQEQCFVVEGGKNVKEVLQSGFTVKWLVATSDFLAANRELADRFEGEISVATAATLKGLGDFRTNDSALAVVQMVENIEPAIKQDAFYLVLDDLRDPGNLGTIIRTADWYGITGIIASPETADVYNSKVIAASMGSFTRVGIYYTNLPDYLRKSDLPIFGTFLTGENIHLVDRVPGGLIVIGNEANGISSEVEKLVTRRITIPRFGRAESLNAAVATAIVCDNLVRLKTS